MSYANRVLRVNLTTKKIISLPLPEQLKQEYLGGRGFAVKMLYELLPKRTDALSPDNLLVFATGPLNGTMAPASASVTVATRSPLTGLLCVDTASGFFASEMKFAGYDMIIIEGKSDELVYLEIDDDRAEIKPADWLRGRGTHATTDLLHERLGDDYKVAAIGPAGENKILYASIVCDQMDRLARGGPGAVMGSKNLKAIAVHGTGDVALQNTDRFLFKMKDIHTALRNDRMFSEMSRYGTTTLVNVANSNSALLIRNGQNGTFNRIIGVSRNTIDNLSHGPDKKLVDRPCSACIMPCKAFIENNKGERRTRPDFFSIASLGPNLGISNANTVREAAHLCEDLGLDPLSVGGSIAFLMECYQRKMYTDEPIEWGNDELVLKLIRQIALKQADGAAEILARGVRNMTRLFSGSRDFAMEVKGLEIPAIDGRGAKGHALAMAVSNRGGDTTLHNPTFELLSKTPAEAEDEFVFASAADPLDWQGKANMVIWHEYFGALLDSTSICDYYGFITYSLKPGDIAELLTYAIGSRFTEMDVMMVGERISTVERLFNIRNGMNPVNDDTLPRRFLSDRLNDGKAANQVVELSKMLQEYYMLRGYDENGMPKMDNLQSLQIVRQRTPARR